MRVAAIQLQPVLGDVEANLAACEALADEAGRCGAAIIVLPEFFTTGMGFVPALADAALPFDGPAAELLERVARRYGAVAGGSFLCRDEDGEVRNAFVVAGPEGLLGRHDKDIPTMWENCFYVGGSDSGVIASETHPLGVALCLEFNRVATARRLRGRVDVVLGGSSVWSVPDFLPGPVYRRLDDRMRALDGWGSRLARLVGAPVIEATHCGPLDCGVPWLPFVRYRTTFRGGAQVLDATGRTLARREPAAGPGFVIADLDLGATKPLDPLPERYWIEPMGLVGEMLWRYQRVHGRWWYRRHRVGRTSGRA